ncbi:nucleotidyltransferase family protein [Janthinobacterium sp.]|uniref:nucleotidyltransferase family protein n=1 Tax=Janthinobacterium sp. TaxID=1871054 RepID=UPI00293D85B0|nr:nucleotidyltransferase family protein [Janthinobacterium sp.]
MSLPPPADPHARLLSIVYASPWMMAALAAVRELGLESWCIGAGAVRNLVWDALHGHQLPSALADIDVAYFDTAALGPEREAALQERLAQILPGQPWEVCNQAAVHLWFESCFGYPVAPLQSLEEAVASWPEYATAVALTMQPDGTVDIIAPYGLGDLFDIVVRRNPARVSVDTYRRRVARKGYAERWPRVTILP